MDDFLSGAEGFGDNANSSRTSDFPGKADRPLRIAILSYRSTPHVGGQGIYVDYLSRALVERGHEVHVLSGPPYPDCDARVNIIRIPSLDLYAKPHNGHFALRPRHLLNPTDLSEYFSHLTGRFSEPLTFSRRVARFFSQTKIKFDVILDNQSLGAGLLASSVQSIPFVGVIHHPITKDLRLALEAEQDPKKRFLIRRWYSFHKEQINVARKLPFFVCPSTAIKADIVEEFGMSSGQLSVIPLGVDQHTFHPNRGVERSPRQIITTASADIPLKGLSVLLEALAQLRVKHPDVSLKVIGKLRKGATSETLDRLNLRNAVTFESDLTRDELADAFASASVSVTPSLYEGFGLPCAEAMSCGTPVITTNGGALPEVVGNAGTIVKKGDAESLASALKSFFSLTLDERSRLGEAALKRAQTAFNWSTIAPQYEDLFLRAIQATC